MSENRRGIFLTHTVHVKHCEHHTSVAWWLAHEELISRFNFFLL